MYLIFENKGEMNLEIATIFGISIKNDEQAIGFFGTGLKMAISVILRLKGKIHIYSGKNSYCFHTKELVVRDKSFDIVYMNNEKLNFTTHNAINWKSWEALRELVCNCKDEQGKYYLAKTLPKTQFNKTFVVVECNELLEEYKNIDSFILNNNNKLYETDELKVYKGSTDSLFYKGVKVHNVSKPFKYTYNFKKDIDLSEDRDLKYQFYVLGQLARNITSINCKKWVKDIINIGKEFEEYDLNYTLTSSVSEEFKSLDYEEYNEKTPPSLRVAFKPSLEKQLSNIKEYELTNREVSQLKEAKEFVFSFIKDEYQIKIVETLGNNVLGFADRENNIIWLAYKVFEFSYKYIAGVIYEEYIHIKYNVDDYTREFQNQVISDLMKSLDKRINNHE